MLSTVPAYRCKVTHPDTLGWLRVGLRRHLVEVVEVSRSAFTVRLPKSLGHRVQIGKKLQLYHKGMLWAVVAKQKWLHNDDHVDVECEQLAELIKPRVKRTAVQKSQMVSAGNSSDMTLIAAFASMLLLALLLMPSWGGKWGTSQIICDGITVVFKAMASLVTGRMH